MYSMVPVVERRETDDGRPTSTLINVPFSISYLYQKRKFKLKVEVFELRPFTSTSWIAAQTSVW